MTSLFTKNIVEILPVRHSNTVIEKVLLFKISICVSQKLHLENAATVKENCQLSPSE